MTGVTSIVGAAGSAAAAAPPSPADQATSKLAELQADPAWRSKLIAGNGPAVKEFSELMAAKSAEPAGDRISKILDGSVEIPLLELTNGGLTTRKVVDFVAGLREQGIGDAAIRQVLEENGVSQAEHNMAKQVRADRLANVDFTKKWLSGDREAGREMMLLNIIVSAGVKEEAA
jgi:hypothetical protein